MATEILGLLFLLLIRNWIDTLFHKLIILLPRCWVVDVVLLRNNRPQRLFSVCVVCDRYIQCMIFFYYKPQVNLAWPSKWFWFLSRRKQASSTTLQLPEDDTPTQHTSLNIAAPSCRIISCYVTSTLETNQKLSSSLLASGILSPCCLACFQWWILQECVSKWLSCSKKHEIVVLAVLVHHHFSWICKNVGLVVVVICKLQSSTSPLDHSDSDDRRLSANWKTL